MAARPRCHSWQAYRQRESLSGYGRCRSEVALRSRVLCAPQLHVTTRLPGGPVAGICRVEAGKTIGSKGAGARQASHRFADYQVFSLDRPLGVAVDSSTSRTPKVDKAMRAATPPRADATVSTKRRRHFFFAATKQDSVWILLEERLWCVRELALARQGGGFDKGHDAVWRPGRSAVVG